jgi:hypothetical protein
VDASRVACDNHAVTETPEQRVARLEAELATAKVEALQKQLAQAQAQTGQLPPSASAYERMRPPVQFGKSLRPSEPDTRLTPAPRSVPFSYRAVAIPFSFWTLFTLFMIAVSPIALWIFVPIAGVVVALLTFVVVLAVLVRKSARRQALLRWGEVAHVLNVEPLSRGTYYSGTTVQNVRMAQAHGWTVERRWYSGPVTKTRVDYELLGTQASIVIRGLDYDGGVILADSRDPLRALCVSSFPYDLERDEAGNWTGRIPSRVKVGSLVMIDLMLAWTAGMCWLWGYQAAQLHGLVRK